jgi:nitrogen fixation protein FixH
MVGESAIQVRVRCLSEPCTVVASATSKSPSIHSGTARVQLAVGEADTLSLPLAPRQRGKLKAALEAGRSPTFTVKATAHNQAGTRIPLSITVEAKKPKS